MANAAGTTVLPASFLNLNPGVLPGSSGGFSSITVPNGLFTFSVFDSGGVDNEDVQNITLTNNGDPVALTSDAGGDGSGTTLFFLSDGRRTIFDANTNPAVSANRFSATISPGTAILSLESVSSINAGNTGAFAVTSTVITGTADQAFRLRQTPSVPPSDDLDFARLGILVQN